MPRAAVDGNNRVALRVRPADKAVILRAAALAQTDMTNFILRSVLREARSVVEEHERVELSARDSRRVMKLLENPLPPKREAAPGRSRFAGSVMSLPGWREVVWRLAALGCSVVSSFAPRDAQSRARSGRCALIAL
jgi:uncharacterized protein (DUF1778 family)